MEGIYILSNTVEKEINRFHIIDNRFFNNTNSTQNSEILRFIIDSGMIDINDVQNSIEAMKRKELLEKHPYKIWKGKDGNWYTYLPKADGDRKQIKRKQEKDIKDVVIDYWESQTMYSFKERYNVWKERQKKCGRSDNTIYKYEKDYIRFFEGDIIERMKVQDIDDECISEFILRLLKQKEIPYKALKAMYGYMKGVFDKCIIDKLIKENPCKYIDLPIYKQYCKEEKIKTTEERTLSEVENRTLLKKLEESYKKKPSYIVQYAIELSLYTGMRVGELSAFKWSDINFDKKTITICRSEKHNRKTNEYYISATKNDKIRIIPLTDEMEDVLLRVKKVELANGFLTEFVFSNENGRIHTGTISSAVRNITMSKEFGHTKSIHAIRRTLNSNLRCNGMSATVAASILGHTEKVNEENYTYDVSNMAYKTDIIASINKKTAQG